jgi:hypothetical protein
MRSILAAGVALLGAIVVLAHPMQARAQSLPPQAEKAAFYRDVQAKRYDAAVSVGAAYRRHAPADDRFALDYAYALIAAHRTDDATALLHRLATSRVAAVRTAAQRQLIAMTPPPVPVATPAPFANAYEQYAGGDLIASRDAFRAGLVEHPNDAGAWHQLAYIELALHDAPAYIDALQHYVALAPKDDPTKLQLSYALFAAKDYRGGRALLVELAKSPDAAVAADARRQLAVLPGSSVGDRLDVFGYALNDSRFHDTFYGFDARYRLAPWRIYPYVSLQVSNDAKASGVPASYVLNDDAAVLAGGFRTALTPILYAFVEAGGASSFRTGVTQSDLRFGLLLSTRLGAGGYKPQTQIDASLVHYSRYLDTISYGTVAHDFYIGSKIVRGVVGVDTALDTNRAYYSNTVDTFAGLQVRRGPATFRVIGLGGYYLGRGIDVPAQRTYSSIRTELLYGLSR